MWATQTCLPVLLTPGESASPLLKDLIDFFLCEGWTTDTIWYMGVTAVNGQNAGQNAHAATFAKSTVFELIGRFNMDVINKQSFLPLKIDYDMN